MTDTQQKELATVADVVESTLISSPEQSDVTAVYIHIEGDPVEQAKAMPARSYREVVIWFNGREVEMTFDEFLQRVGLAE